MSDASPHVPAHIAVGRQIELAAAQNGWNLAELARRSGIGEKTLRRIASGDAGRRSWRTTTKAAIEDALGWDPGEIDQRLEDAAKKHHQQEAQPGGHQMMTEYGLLTWSNNPDGTRNYRLSKKIGGEQRGVIIDNSTLTPEEAVEDLQRGLRVLEAMQ